MSNEGQIVNCLHHTGGFIHIFFIYSIEKNVLLKKSISKGYFKTQA